LSTLELFHPAVGEDFEKEFPLKGQGEQRNTERVFYLDSSIGVPKAEQKKGCLKRKSRKRKTVVRMAQ